MKNRKGKTSKNEILSWIKSPKNIYLCTLLAGIIIIGFINNSLLAVYVVISVFICYGLILGLLYYFFNKN